MRNVQRFLQSLVVGRDLAVQLNDVGKDVWERAKVVRRSRRGISLHLLSSATST